MDDPKHPKPTDKHIDVRDLELVDIPPDHVARLSKLRAGHAEAVEGVLRLPAATLKRAGVHAEEVQDLAAHWATIQRIDEVMPAVEKLLELLKETRLVHGHEVALKLGEMASQVRRRADHAHNAGEIAGPFEPLLAYQSGPALRAAATKAKAAKVAAEEKEGG